MENDPVGFVTLMDFADLSLLVGAGLAGGFVAGLVGVGGGIIFAPVLFLFFQSRGVSGDVITPLTLGTSLFCTFMASSVSAYTHRRAGAVEMRVALIVGLLSAVSVFVTSRLVTTRPWYDASLFQIVFASVLLVVAVRLLVPSTRGGAAAPAPALHGPSPATAVALGAVTGGISTAAGVGGGVVMVPAFHRLLSFPMRKAVGTSSAAIVLISLAGVAAYGWLGRSAALPAGSTGFVNIPAGVMLALPAAITARFGAWTAHRIDTRKLQIGFGVFAVVVALRLIWEAVQP